MKQHCLCTVPKEPSRLYVICCQCGKHVALSEYEMPGGPSLSEDCPRAPLHVNCRCGISLRHENG